MEEDMKTIATMLKNINAVLWVIVLLLIILIIVV